MIIKDYRLLLYFTAIIIYAVDATGGARQDIKMCRFRERTLEREVYKLWTGYGCYNYTNEDVRLNFIYPMRMINYTTPNGVALTPATFIDNTTYFVYDYDNNETLQYLSKSYQTAHFLELWVKCAVSAMDCCDNYMDNFNILPTDDYPCPQIWDGWDCFPPAQANTVSRRACPIYSQSTMAKVCTLLSEKTCTADSGWVQKTNYGICSRAPVYRKRHNFHVICLSVAIGICLPAAFIFLYFRKLRNNTRIILHRNLLLAIIIRCILTIMSKELIILDNLKSASETNNVMVENGVPCRILAFFEGVAKNSMYAFMLIDCFYLHKLIVRSFAKEPNINILFAVAGVLSFLPSLIWATLRAVNNGDSCWMIDSGDGGDQWVLDGFRIFILILNMLLLVDIIIVMLMKLRKSSASTSTSRQTRSTLRATLFLMPLFGIHIIVITNRNMVLDDTCFSEDLYLYSSYVLEGFQGIAVAILFCYLSAEVHVEIQNEFRKLAIYLEQRYGWSLQKKQNFRRRTTAATYVEADARLSTDGGGGGGRDKNETKI